MPTSGARRILGVDPGTRVAGWGVIERDGNASRLVACGAVRMKAGPIERRLATLAAELRTVIGAHRPTVIVVERPFFGKNANSALAVGMARGVAFLAAAEAGVIVREYPPAIVKQAVTGNGAAAKSRVAQMVRVLLGLAAAPEPADVTDALALAIADAHRGGLGAHSGADATDEPGGAPVRGGVR